MQERRGICWSHGGTVGTITISSAVSRAGAMLRGDFDRGLLACDFTPAGKYRNGAARWWCRTHQRYWGVKADISAFDPAREKLCGAHAQAMDFVLDPTLLDMRHYASVRIVFTGNGMRVAAAPLAGTRAIDALFPAIAITGIAGVFAAPGIDQVNVTPPALRALLDARARPRLLGCLDCARCGHPHLDLGDFALKEHRRHYCGNCGNDSTHSKSAIVSNPLFALEKHFDERLTFD